MLKFGISPCPNDTFIFFGIIEKKVNTYGLNFDFVIEDVESLNSLCLKKELDISKISSHAIYYLQKDYELLSSGGALSEFGPVVIAKDLEKIKNISTVKVALPGRLTTASLLMWLYWQKNFSQKKYELKFMPFYEIIDKVAKGEADLGVVIHEGRFIYSLKGLKLVADLGEFWMEETLLPIPLGCIVSRKSLNIKETVEKIIKESLNYAYSHFDEAMDFTKKYSQEISEDVIKLHIQCYVNDFTFDMGQKGIQAINELIKKIQEHGIWS
ncbi:1,4-dihydroxy-6-naphthoate synthase [Thermodesulfovibrio aggregans]|uniref:1,4-dihydroxy-6-naphtoate synthase n=1 Tax=Thermodesulfovibrio aggregans TaxID=86166 RepID=A0A0U9HPI3_9BACT|nr:1,4-dihydroxy-6-naphthoate synthase [Thermodesulfovibrio aggregans]GAQ94944.1 1,4-dihydroxy-6-naphthoate synthase [Thermodesulfovibrio aggregans]